MALLLKQFVTILTLAVLSIPSVHAQAVVLPGSPADLNAMFDDIKYQTDPSFRALAQAANDYAVKSEQTETSKPYTNASFYRFLQKYASDPRTVKMTEDIVAALGAPGEIDLYLLLGQSNMTGSGGPGASIQSYMQIYADTGHTVRTLNCGQGGSGIQAWNPDIPAGGLSSFYTYVTGPILNGQGEAVAQYNLTRECIEIARVITSRSNAKVRGIFFYQGETEVILSHRTGNSDFVTNWPITYLRIIDYLRQEFGDLPAVHAQLAITSNPSPVLQQFWTQLKSLQAGVAVPYSAYIITDDLTLVDGIHLDADSQQVAGTRFGEAMQALLSQ